MKRTSWVALGVILAVMVIVVYSTFQIGGVRCEVCITFHGRQVCRSVDGTTEHEAQMAAITNACALLASGVTDTIACQNAPRDRLNLRRQQATGCPLLASGVTDTIACQNAPRDRLTCSPE